MSESLELTAAACQLAREIFMARNEAFGLDDSWQTLSPSQKQIFVKHAADVIKAHAPIRSKVVGLITPTEPWGVER
jgi:hypothetical protein